VADLPPDDRTGGRSSAAFDASSINPATSWSTRCCATTTLAADRTHKLMERPAQSIPANSSSLLHPGRCHGRGVDELRELKKRNRLLEHQNKVLRRADAYLSQRTCGENDLPARP